MFAFRTCLVVFRIRGFTVLLPLPGNVARFVVFFVDLGVWNYSTVLSHQCVLHTVLFSCVVCAVRLAASIPYLY